MVNKTKHSNRHDKAKLKIEWVNFNESPLAEEAYEQLFFGVCNSETGEIHIFLDNLLKTFGFTGFEPVEKWFTIHSTDVLVHELIHYLNPEWTEVQVEEATQEFMEAWLSPKKATRLKIYIGNKLFEHLLTGDNQVLEVKD